jgi:hypothetical protein
MAAIADIVAYDGESTPVLHTFYADHVEYTGNDLIALWSEKVVGVPEYAQGTIRLSKKKVASGMVRVGLRVDLPVMESVSGQNLSGYTAAPKVAYVDSSEQVQWVHARSLAQGRNNTRWILRNVTCNATASNTPITSGFVYDAIVRLVFPS